MALVPQSGRTGAPEVRVKTYKERTLLFTVLKGPYEETSEKGITALIEFLMTNNIFPWDSIYEIFLNDPTEVKPEEIMTEIGISVGIKELPENPNFSLRSEGEMTVAYTVVIGAPSDTLFGQAFGAIMAYVSQNGQMAGPPYAVYYNNPGLVTMEDMIIEIGIPFIPKPKEG